jgi:hypothetical protein
LGVQRNRNEARARRRAEDRALTGHLENHARASYPCESKAEDTSAMVKGIGPLFGVEIDGERKNLFGSLASAKELQAAVVAQGGKAVIFAHSDAEIKGRDAAAAEDWFFDLAMQYYIAARVSAVLVGLMPVCGNSSRNRDVFKGWPRPKIFYA